MAQLSPIAPTPPVHSNMIGPPTLQSIPYTCRVPAEATAAQPRVRGDGLVQRVMSARPFWGRAGSGEVAAGNQDLRGLNREACSPKAREASLLSSLLKTLGYRSLHSLLLSEKLQGNSPCFRGNPQWSWCQFTNSDPPKRLSAAPLCRLSGAKGCQGPPHPIPATALRTSDCPPKTPFSPQATSAHSLDHSGLIMGMSLWKGAARRQEEALLPAS